jgi:hypothetical protein
MQQKHFVFGKAWKDFVAEEKIKRTLKDAIQKTVTETEVQTGMDFEKHLKHVNLPDEAEELKLQRYHLLN